ncbi:MAG: SH3 domain-containing protein [Anaerolineae bacterium]|nr:SH3 domain-containing protein [Anaerolineae bacterium]
MFRRMIPLLLITALLAALIIGPAAAPVTAQGGTAVTISNLNVRVGPSAEEGIIATLPRGTVVTLLGRNRIGDWVYVGTPTLNGGWVASRFLNWDDTIDLGSLPVVNNAGQTGGAGSTLGFSGALIRQPNAWPVQQMNLRVGPDTSEPSLGLIPAGTPLVVEGRTPDGVWAFAQAPDGSWAGWVAAGFLSLSLDLDFDALPVTTAQGGWSNLGGAAPVSIPEEENAHLQLLIDRLASVPVIPAISERAQDIFALGQGMGNRADVFSKIGDCHTDNLGFLFGFGQSDYNLGAYGSLQATVDFFSVTPPRDGVPNSFVNWGAGANSAFTAESLLNDIWADPAICQPGETPLVCEYRLTRPALALILLGSVDTQVYDAGTFEFHLHEIVQQTIDRGVIPVLSTIPAHPDYFWERTLEYNRIILDLAQREDLPVINYWLALRSLPNYGLASDNFHLSESGSCTHFTSEETQYGLVLRNLITLQTLDQMRQSLLQQ